MNIPNLVNVAISLIFIYLVLSLLVSAIQEYITSLLEWRAGNLKANIIRLLSDDSHPSTITESLYKNPLIQSLNQQGNRLFKTKSIGPSYIDSTIFSAALLELLKEEYGLKFEKYTDSLNELFNQLKEELKYLRNSCQQTSQFKKELPQELVRSLLALVRQAECKVDSGEATIKDFQKEIAYWFEQSMERASGVYKRNAIGVALIIGLIIAVVGNVDTIYLVQRLYNDPSLSQTISEMAQQQVQILKNQCDAQKTVEDKNQCIKSELNKFTPAINSFPLGWELAIQENLPSVTSQRQKFLTFIPLYYQTQQLNPLITLLGWIISAIAIAQGSPFWFELLNKFLNVRSTGKKPP
jgi:hypothetical protein